MGAYRKQSILGIGIDEQGGRMRTTLRGNGRYKQDLLLALIAKYGPAPFTYKEASALPTFERPGSFKLRSDGWLKCNRKPTCNVAEWRVPLYVREEFL